MSWMVLSLNIRINFWKLKVFHWSAYSWSRQTSTFTLTFCLRVHYNVHVHLTYQGLKNWLCQNWLCHDCLSDHVCVMCLFQTCSCRSSNSLHWFPITVTASSQHQYYPLISTSAAAAAEQSISYDYLHVKELLTANQLAILTLMFHSCFHVTFILALWHTLNYANKHTLSLIFPDCSPLNAFTWTQNHM